jgi:uncharacterized protein
MATSTSNPVGWFEIGTDDPDTAQAFYGDVFGWTFIEQDGYRIITTGKDDPLQGGIQDTTAPGLSEGTPRTYAVPCIQVEDVAAAAADIEAHGGKVTVPATAMPTGLVYARFTDPAGNQMALFSPPPQP